jgi:lipoprotein NlpI
MRINCCCVLNLLILTQLMTTAAVADETVDKAQNAAGEVKAAELESQLKAFPSIVDTDDDAVGKYSRRGDLHVFLGKFAEAEADYKKMSMLKPDLDASHWRLGIAMYLAGHPEDAAAQFDKYHSFDNVDRENGIWRYLSHRAAFGKEKAREQLLKYEKDDRPPFREVYQLFEGTMTADQVLQSISPDLPESSQQSRLFYAQLYVGLNAAVEDKPESALKALREAVKNEWPREAGFGPDYMWHVGRLQYLGLKASAK